MSSAAAEQVRSPDALRRDTDRGVIAGVLAGLADRLGIDPLIARVAFVVIAVASGGLGLVAYALAWALLPTAEGDAKRRSAAPPRSTGARSAITRRGRLALGVGLLTLAVLLSFRELGIWWSDALVWPLVLAASGVALLWRQSAAATTVEEAPAAETGAGRRRRERASLLRIYRGGFGVALVLGAALLFLSANDVLGAARDAAITVVVVIVAVALILAPFLWRLGRRLASERTERIRSQEKAELAAHLHDSVLQTLTLMQKRAEEPGEVAALARRQERELREWLAGDAAPAEGGLARALTRAGEEVEDDHRVTVDAVIVGDRELAPGLEALVGASREAMTNAAKFGDGSVSLFAEIGADSVEVFVRDRGAGFDPSELPEGRHGIRESIIGRMERHGGSAEISSGPSGTEVALRIDLEVER